MRLKIASYLGDNMKDFKKSLLYSGVTLLFVLFLVWFSNWLTQKPNEPKIEDTGEKTYACTSEWEKDKVIQDCKWYPVYKKASD